jgi:4-diphosphocytidyl-2-C-methyl-D-erythritol kinase
VTSGREAAPAKLNLALHVRARRPDGYHALETLFVFAEVGDTVAWEADAPDGAFSLTIDGPFAAALGEDPDNLVTRAARTLAGAAGVARGARLRLTKRLPVASGLGGGSSDAAATLRLLNRVWRLGMGPDALARLALALGADAPACVLARPLRGEGRGERLEPVDFGGAWAVLANPGVAVPTGPVFRAWDGVDRGPLARGDAMRAALAGRNDLETPATTLAPEVAIALAALAALPGVDLARMSGSGATCFALFADAFAAEAAAAALARDRPDWWVVATRLPASSSA